MFGLLYILIMYLIVFGVCFLVKFLIKKFTKKEEVRDTSSKIYYITNNSKPKRKKRVKAPEIAIKGSIIDKDEFEN